MVAEPVSVVVLFNERLIPGIRSLMVLVDRTTGMLFRSKFALEPWSVPEIRLAGVRSLSWIVAALELLMEIESEFPLTLAVTPALALLIACTSPFRLLLPET